MSTQRTARLLITTLAAALVTGLVTSSVLGQTPSAAPLRGVPALQLRRSRRPASLARVRTGTHRGTRPPLAPPGAAGVVARAPPASGAARARVAARARDRGVRCRAAPDRGKPLGRRRPGPRRNLLQPHRQGRRARVREQVRDRRPASRLGGRHAPVHAVPSLAARRDLPAESQTAGLEASLSDLLAPLLARGIDARLEVEGRLRLTPEVEQLLFRTAQGALRNVLAHAVAKSVELRITVEGPRAILTIDDDGRGFEAEEAERRRAEGYVGLSLLADRAAEIGGSLEVQSEPGRGTRVRLEVGGS